MLNRKVFTGFLLLIIGAFLIKTVAKLWPETSLFAQGAVDFKSNTADCLGCHSQKKPESIDRSLSCRLSPNKIEQVASDHPPYQGNCQSLLAYFEVMRLRNTYKERSASHISNPLIAGEQLARQYYCFQCHGELGQGGFPNQGSLKGYIPGYFGDDYLYLTNDGDVESIESWIRHGIEPNLISQPLVGYFASYFIAKQSIQMPHFDSLPEREIRTLVNYVELLHSFGPLDSIKSRLYDELSRQPMDLKSLIDEIDKINHPDEFHLKD